MAEEKTVEEPGVKLQQLLNDIYEEKPTMVPFCGRNVKIGWIKNGTQRKFSDIMASEEDPHKANVKLATVIMLNNIWKIRFLYWLVWRWYYYVKDVDITEILHIIDVAKKKVPQGAFFLVTMFSTEMTDLMMTMTKKEVRLIQAERRGATPTA